MGQKVTQLLQCARDLITDPKNWTTGVAARDKNGQPTGVRDKDACCFCSMGALSKCAPYTNNVHFWPAIDALATQVRWKLKNTSGDISTYNDSHSHGEVLELFDAAIAAEKEKGL